MALVYNSVAVVYNGYVRSSIEVPLYPRLKSSIAINFNILGLVRDSFEALYSINNYEKIAQSITITFAGSIRRSISVPYNFEYRIAQSVAVPIDALTQVRRSVGVVYSLPGYTFVRKSHVVLCRYTDQTLLTPSTVVTVTLL